MARDPTRERARAPSDRQPGGLYAETVGSGPRVALAHGFTQTGRVWGGLDVDLALDHEVVRFDLPGHGRSADVRAGLPEGAELLAEAAGPGTYLGYSMGARYCLHVALAHPDLVERLVIISGTAGLDDADDRRARRASDEALADRLDPPGGADGDPIGTFLEQWMGNPLFGTVPEERNGWAERCTNTGPGLASSLRLAGTGTQEPLWDRLASLDLPTLVVCGARDDKYVGISRRLAAAIGAKARLFVVEDADHAPHLQQPETVADAVRSFIDGPGTGSGPGPGQDPGPDHG